MRLRCARSRHQRAPLIRSHAAVLELQGTIGGRLPQDSATSEIESRELLYHSWRTPKIACHFCNIRQKRSRNCNYWLGSTFFMPVTRLRLVLAPLPPTAEPAFVS